MGIGKGPILVVDDQAPVQAILKVVLEREGCTVLSAGTAQEALDAIAETPPSLILVDKGLPDGMDGLTLIEELRNSGVAVPIILMSGDPTLSGHLANSGATAFLAKPFSPTAVLKLVEECLPG